MSLKVIENGTIR